MAASTTPFVVWPQTKAARTAVRAKEAAAAYETAFAMAVPPPAVAANRAMPTALITTNSFGQNTPAIAVSMKCRL